MTPFRSLLLWTLGAMLALSLLTVLRRRGRMGWGFAALLSINLGLVIAAVERPAEDIWLYGAIALALVILVVPMVLVNLTRRALAKPDFGRAVRLLGLRQLVQPGLGLEHEREALAGLALAQQGRSEEAIAALRAQLREVDSGHPYRLALIGRLMAILIYERRFADATQLFDAEGAMMLAAVSPTICGNMVRAFAEIGEFARAAHCQAMLEQSPFGLDPRSANMVNSARLALLAHLGRVETVDKLLEKGSPFLPEIDDRRRLIWRGVARSRAGDTDDAQAMWQRVAEQSHDARSAEAAAWRLANTDVIATPDPLDEDIADVLNVITERALVQQQIPVRTGRFVEIAPVTTVLLLANLGIYFALLATGSPEDPWVLLRYGANFPYLTLSSEPWRLITSAFVHGGAYHLHLVFNVFALFLIGRFCEQLFGRERFLVIFLFAALGGSYASAMVAADRLSVGASGAIFGLLGASFVGLFRLRGEVPEGWRKQLLVNLTVIVALQLLIGFGHDFVDNAAHLGGLGCGILGAFAFGPRRPGLAVDKVAFALGTVLVIGTVLSFAMLARTSVKDMLGHIPQRLARGAGVELKVPAHWRAIPGGMGFTLQDPLIHEAAPTMQISPPEGVDVGSGVMALAKKRMRSVFDELRVAPNIRDVQTLQALTKLSDHRARARIRVLISNAAYHVDIHFIRQKDLLAVAMSKLPPDRHQAYAPLVERAIASLTISTGTRSP